MSNKTIYNDKMSDYKKTKNKMFYKYSEQKMSKH